MKYIIFLIIIFSHQLHAEEVALPELGDHSAVTLSADQEWQIGAEVVRRMRQAGYIIEDPLVSSYVDELGRSLSIHTQTEQMYSFFIVDAPSINAFALPGGFIGIHSGLILASANESELASVVAHEIAHVSQHHLARSVEQANRMQLPLTVAVIAAILLSGGDADIANAAIASSLGGSAQMQLNFTRSHEQEADRVGMQLLAHSEFDPRGMAAFFSKLLNESRYYGAGVPEFLTTHPVTTSRLAEAQSAAAGYPRKMRADSASYLITKARLKLHHSKSPAGLLSELAARPEGDNNITEYLRAITLIKLNQLDEAEATLQDLLDRSPESIAYLATLGQLYIDRGKLPQAIALYDRGLKRYPQNELISLSLAKCLMLSQKYSPARSHIQTVLRHNQHSRLAYRLLSQLESETGNRAASHLALAEYYLLLNEPHSALQQLELARGIKDQDFYHSSRIEALSEEIKESVERQQQVTRN